MFDKVPEKDLKLNLKENEFGKASINNYMRHILSSEGLFTEPKKVDSVLNMKPTSNTNEVHSFLDLVTYWGKFISHFTTSTEPLRGLACPKGEFVWNEEQESAFSKIKVFIFKVHLAFNSALKTKIVASASKQDLDTVLFQRTLKIVFFNQQLFASCFLLGSETRYSRTERETVAVVFSCERFKNYVYGSRFTVINHC